jgi:hypothetical protein
LLFWRQSVQEELSLWLKALATQYPQAFLI